VITAERPATGTPASGRARLRLALGLWPWAAVPFAVLYLVLLATQFSGVITSSGLDADAVSAPVIGELFGAAPAHAHVVLGTFGWYATLLFELATKWLPAHRQVWEAAPYAMVLAAAGLIGWSAYAVAGRVAASLSAVILLCAAPPTLLVLMSMTQHAPVWFCLAVLATLLVWLLRPAARARARHPALLGVVAVVVGVVIGANAASDPLLTVAGLAPFLLALAASARLLPRADRAAPVLTALAMLAVAALAWVGTDALMSSLNVAPEPGVPTNHLASAAKLSSNFRLWWRSIAVLGNGDFFDRNLNFTAGLAATCAVLSIGAVALLPRVGWHAVRRTWTGTVTDSPARVAWLSFWCASAVLLTGAFLVSGYPGDLASYRYLVGLIYAAAAVIPVVASGHPAARLAAVVGTCVFALAGVISMGQRTATRPPRQGPEPRLVPAVQRIAARQHLQLGYAAYWDAAPITWGTHYRVRVYPVSVCDQGQHLCPFDLHVISSWYDPRPGVRSFLLADRRTGLVPAPPPGLGRPTAVYRLGPATMYVYPYDLAQRFAVT